MEMTAQLIFIFSLIVFTEQHHHFFVPFAGEGLGFPSTVYHDHHGHFLGHERLFHPGFPIVTNPTLPDLRTIAQIPVVTPSGAKLVAPAIGAYSPAEPAKSSGVKPKQAVDPPSADGRPTAITEVTDFAVEKSVMPKPVTAAKAVPAKVPF